MTSHTLTAEVQEAFTTAAVLALQELMQTEALPCEAAGAGEVFAEITLRRPVPGRFVLEMPLAVIEALARRYLPGEALAADMLDDTAGELANVIAGQAKTMLKGTPYHFLLTTPRAGRAAPVSGGAVMAFLTDAGPFWLRLELEPCEGA